MSEIPNLSKCQNFRKMGIKDLWTILTPFCERRPLYELQNKKVAVDLSCWVCEAKNITEYTIQPRMYLRNLYFRTCYLLLMDVSPIFVLEGKAPELKYKTIAARNAIQFKGAKSKSDGVKTGKDRTRFHHTLKLCKEMLKIMGLACIKGDGEAEALCAHLNEDNLVDGIISQDSDCFAYGAKVVYRNFSISTQGQSASKGGSVDIYDITKAYQALNFGRNKIIAMALLCGSDYSEGVYGIGKDSVLKLFDKLKDEEVLERLRSWRSQKSLYDEFERKISDSNHCTSCGHPGKLQSHNRKGCPLCHTTKGCDFTRFKNERLEIKNELNIRSKALADLDFPNEELIQEFLTKRIQISELDLKWQKPDLVNFIKFTVKYLTWDEVYSFEKFLPVLTRWQLLNWQQIGDMNGIVVPKTIKKRRSLKGVPSYEIIWENDQFLSLIPQEQRPDDLDKLFSTVEPQTLVQTAHPGLVDEFENLKKPKTKRKKGVKEIDKLMQNISIDEPVKKVKTLDSFVIFKSSTPSKEVCYFDPNMSNFGDENDLEVSKIIDDIVKRRLPNHITNELEKFGLQVETDNNCSFFINGPVENDLFEKTFNEHFYDDCSDEY